MRAKLHSHIRHNIVGYVALFCFAIGGTALAAIPGGDSVIDGCYADRTGVLRVIDTEADPPRACRASETSVSWNQQGPKGDPGEVGPQGPDGAPGPPGSAGSDGVGGFQRVIETTDIGGKNRASNVVNCPPGKRAIGGGFSLEWWAYVQTDSVASQSEGWSVAILSPFETADDSTAPFPDGTTLKLTVNCVDA